MPSVAAGVGAGGLSPMVENADLSAFQTCWVGNAACVNAHGSTTNDLGVWDCMLTVDGAAYDPLTACAGNLGVMCLSGVSSGGPYSDFSAGVPQNARVTENSLLWNNATGSLFNKPFSNTTLVYEFACSCAAQWGQVEAAASSNIVGAAPAPICEPSWAALLLAACASVAAVYAGATALDTVRSIRRRSQSGATPLSRAARISLGTALAFAVYVFLQMMVLVLLALGDLSLLNSWFCLYFFGSSAGDFFFGLASIVSLLAQVRRPTAPLSTVCLSIVAY